ncbi:fimbria/pilus periplasmic chaperone [Pseudomonas protegens]|uniref:fimbria/pilus periplasmic chaperone n=1 Tax=Pseudomonas protegens TaxID=380021 RepID=UPI00276D186E|nr:fimbria/pilus periplasmic chaperone [Pseudomonas protegens]MDP9513537.1 fimbria/pilus periplasmic chaperone [Pseudomonas protegens]
MTKSTTVIALLFAFFHAQAMAALTLGSSRIIIQAPKTRAVVMVHNRSNDSSYLAQSWIEDAQGQKLERSPVVALPPIQRLEPMQGNQLNIQALPRVADLPLDRETLFYLNVREVPPRGEDKEVIQIALQRRIKVIYRPQRIRPLTVGLTSPWLSALTLSKEESGRFQLNNATPYHVTLIEAFSDESGTFPVTDFKPMEIPPYSAHRLEGKFSPGVQRPTLVYINDFGGRGQLSFDCRDGVCAVIKNSVRS